MAEINLNWSKLGRNQNLSQVCNKWFQTSKTIVAYNQHERRNKFNHQPGGTTITSTGEIALRVNNHAMDQNGWGGSHLKQYKVNKVNKALLLELCQFMCQI